MAGERHRTSTDVQLNGSTPASIHALLLLKDPRARYTLEAFIQMMQYQQWLRDRKKRLRGK